MTKFIALAALALAACATAQQVTLMPRAPATQLGSGRYDPSNRMLSLDVAGATYRGENIWTKGTLQSRALLVGPGGQMQCELSWARMFASAVGTCVDAANLVYDVSVR